KLFAEQSDPEHVPKWLHVAVPSPADHLQSGDRELRRKQKSEELRDRWRETCERLHRFARTSLSSVKTDLVLGPSETDGVFERCGGLSPESDSLKRLYKGLAAKVEWQRESASAVAAAVIRTMSGNCKPRGLRPKADTWLLFMGPDEVGKSRMACALSELVFGGPPISIRIGYARTDDRDGESDVNLRGKMPIDRVADALRRNPFCVVVLEDVDHADAAAKGVIKRAIETGRLADSHSREVGLGSAVFVLMSNCSSGDLKGSGVEEKILESAHSSWHLELSLIEETRTGKRRPEWLPEEGDRIVKPRKGSEGISLDLNLAIGVNADDDGGGREGSRSSSDLTVDHEHEYGRLAINNCSTSSNAADFIDMVDDAVVFKPVDFGPLRRRISDTITAKFTAIVGNACSLQVDTDALDPLVGTIWLTGGATTDMFDEWSDRVLVPAIQKLKNNLKLEDGSTVRLSSVKGRGCGRRRIDDGGDLLPSSVRIAGV
ncbi:protein SMAX1-like, partial [Ananas comosus]